MWKRMASIGFIPYSTISSNSRAFVPCAKAPTSVPKTILTPIRIAFWKTCLWLATMRRRKSVSSLRRLRDID